MYARVCTIIYRIIITTRGKIAMSTKFDRKIKKKFFVPLIAKIGTIIIIIPTIITKKKKKISL